MSASVVVNTSSSSFCTSHQQMPPPSSLLINHLTNNNNNKNNKIENKLKSITTTTTNSNSNNSLNDNFNGKIIKKCINVNEIAAGLANEQNHRAPKMAAPNFLKLLHQTGRNLNLNSNSPYSSQSHTNLKQILINSQNNNHNNTSNNLMMITYSLN